MLESEWGTMSLSSNFYCFFYSDKNNIFHDKLQSRQAKSPIRPTLFSVRHTKEISCCKATGDLGNPLMRRVISPVPALP